MKNPVKFSNRSFASPLFCCTSSLFAQKKLKCMSSCFVSAWYLIRMKRSISNGNEALCLFAKQITGRQITLTIAKWRKGRKSCPAFQLPGHFWSW